MSTSADVRDAILDIMAERLRLDEPTLEQLRNNGRLDEVTAADSILVVELVLGLEDRFGIRFKADDIDGELICDLDRLTAFVSEATAGS